MITQQSYDLDFSNAKLVLKTLIVGPYAFKMHEIIEISDKILDIFDEWNV